MRRRSNRRKRLSRSSNKRRSNRIKSINNLERKEILNVLNEKRKLGLGNNTKIADKYGIIGIRSNNNISMKFFKKNGKVCAKISKYENGISPKRKYFGVIC